MNSTFGMNGEGLSRGQSRYGNADDWDEAKHPRADDGKFGSGGGGGAGEKAPSKPTIKERAADSGWKEQGLGGSRIERKTETGKQEIKFDDGKPTLFVYDSKGKLQSKQSFKTPSEALDAADEETKK